MMKYLLYLNAITERTSVSLKPGAIEDKGKLPVRLLTALTVLFLIFAGSPLASINTNTVSAETNPYASVGTIVVNTNNTDANFTLIGPNTYTGNGTTWSQTDAPTGTYNITYDPIPGYDTPPDDTQILVSEGTITFTGLYNLSVGTITVTTNNTAAAFSISGPAEYTGSGAAWSQPDAPAGTYTVTFDPIPGYDTPPGDTQTLVSNGAIAFTGLYNSTIYTLTLQATADAYISEFKQENNTNYGTETVMDIRSFLPGSSGNLKNKRSIIMFDTPSLPTGSTILSATLELYAGNVSNETRSYAINAVEQYWSETGVTWNNMPSVASSATSFAATPPSADWMGWNAVPDVQAWINGAPNYGWQISDPNESSPIEYNTTLYTREYSDINFVPRLVVQYTI